MKWAWARPSRLSPSSRFSGTGEKVPRRGAILCYGMHCSIRSTSFYYIVVVTLFRVPHQGAEHIYFYCSINDSPHKVLYYVVFLKLGMELK